MNADREPGHSYRSRISVTPQRMAAFAELSGDNNPIHMDRESARGFGHPEQIAYAGLLLAEVSRIIGVQLPGPGAVCVLYQFDFTAPVYVGESVLFETSWSSGRRRQAWCCSTSRRGASTTLSSRCRARRRSSFPRVEPRDE